MEEGGGEVGGKRHILPPLLPIPVYDYNKRLLAGNKRSTFFGNFTVPTSFGILWYFLSHRFKRNER